jgi:hypothetical protein
MSCDVPWRLKPGARWPLFTRPRRVHAQLTPGLCWPLKKIYLSISDYYSKMCQYAYDLVASRTPLRDDELVTYLLAGLDEGYNFVFTSVVGRTDPIAPSELYSQLLSFDQHTSLQVQSSHGESMSAMSTSRGGRGYSGGHGSGPSSRGSGSGRAIVPTAPTTPPSPNAKSVPRLATLQRLAGIAMRMVPVLSDVLLLWPPLVLLAPIGTRILEL